MKWSIRDAESEDLPAVIQLIKVSVQWNIVRKDLPGFTKWKDENHGSQTIQLFCRILLCLRRDPSQWWS